MKLLHTTSLAQTVDAVNEALFLKCGISSADRLQVSQWIANRQGKENAYARMFAPTCFDLEHGFRVFTGERIISRAALRHMIGEEACRVLLLLKVKNQKVARALQRARRGMSRRLMSSDRYQRTGIYCCGACTVSLWRQSVVKGFDRPRQHLTAGLQALKRHRDGNGKWDRFPFYYTLLALSDMSLPGATDEMLYAAPLLEQILKRRATTKFGKRRLILAERILAGL